MLNKKRAKTDIKYISFLLMLLMVAVLVCGCRPEAKDALGTSVEAKENVQTTNSLTVYFANCDGYMVPISYPSDDLSGEPVKAAILLLLEGPRSENLFRTIPKGTRLKDFYVSNETLFLDFTHEFNKLSNSQDVARAVKSLCLTVDSLPGVTEVQVLIDGELVEEIHGVAMNQILRHGWVNYFGSAAGSRKYVVYFSDRCSTYMVPVTYAANDDVKVAFSAVEKLVAGPENKGLIATSSPGTKLLGLEIKDGIAYVDFSGGITGFGEAPEAEQSFVESLLLTLGQFSDIKGVQIMIDGEIGETLPEGTPIASPLKPLSAPNQIEVIEEG